MHFQVTADLPDTNTTRTKPYRVAEIAEMLDVHPVTVYRDIEAGRLVALRVGKQKGAIRVLPGALTAYLSLLQIQPSASLAEVA